MDLQKSFDQAAIDVQSLKQKPDNSVMLKLYSLFKQSTLGPPTEARPGLMNMVARAKYDAWNAIAKTPQDEAKKQYVELVNNLKKNG